MFEHGVHYGQSMMSREVQGQNTTQVQSRRVIPHCHSCSRFLHWHQHGCWSRTVFTGYVHDARVLKHSPIYHQALSIPWLLVMVGYPRLSKQIKLVSSSHTSSILTTTCQKHIVLWRGHLGFWKLGGTGNAGSSSHLCTRGRGLLFSSALQHLKWWHHGCIRDKFRLLMRI